MNPMTIAAGASAASAFLGFKGNQASARAAEQTAEYNAKLRENEAVLLQRAKIDQEANLRRSNDRLTASQTVATAKSGIEMSGSPYLALADSYFAMERDALRIQYASDIEQADAMAEAAMSRASGAARASGFRTASYVSLLNGASAVAGMQQQQDFFALQDQYRQKTLSS
jgi:hypothetical protein|tara:strand:- start:3047 stop:3556 length:510 start_codon:yes stop_codon:yes gene_type:complete